MILLVLLTLILTRKQLWPVSPMNHSLWIKSCCKNRFHEIKLCHLRGSNTGPSDLQSDALPAELKRLDRITPEAFYVLLVLTDNSFRSSTRKTCPWKIIGFERWKTSWSFCYEWWRKKSAGSRRNTFSWSTSKEKKQILPMLLTLKWQPLPQFHSLPF